MADYIKREVEKIATVIGELLIKLGIGKRGNTVENAYDCCHKDLSDGLNIDLDKLLVDDNPLMYLTAVKGFGPEHLESLAQALRATMPTGSARRDTELTLLIGKILSYLSDIGYVSFSLGKR